jgi:hypothetical protein
MKTLLDLLTLIFAFSAHDPYVRCPSGSTYAQWAFPDGVKQLGCTDRVTKKRVGPFLQIDAKKRILEKTFYVDGKSTHTFQFVYGLPGDVNDRLTKILEIPENREVSKELSYSYDDKGRLAARALFMDGHAVESAEEADAVEKYVRASVPEARIPKMMDARGVR